MSNADLFESKAPRITTLIMHDKTALVSKLADTVPGAMFQVFASSDGRLEHSFISAGVVKLFGIGESEIGNDPGALIRRIHPDDYKIYANLTRRLNETGGRFDLTYRYCHPSRGIIFVQTFATAEQIEGGTIWHAYSSDVTERKLAEMQLQDVISQLSGFFEVSLDLLCLASLEGKFLKVNAAFESALGYSRTELEGRLFFDLVHPDDVKATHSALSKLGGGGQVLNFVNRYRCKDGSYRDIEWRSTPANGLIYAAARDITDRLRHEAEIETARAAAEAANHAKSVFLANMSHEVRTPLNGVVGLAGALFNTALDPRQKEMVALIKSSGETLEHLLSDILDVSKIEAGKLALHVEAFDLKDAVNTAAEIMRVRADEKGLDFEIIYGVNARGLFEGDVVRVRQIISNLASNAVKFTHAGGIKIFVHVEDREVGPAEVRFVVEDTGIGFDPEAGRRLFSRFEQADGSITRTYGGTGLGLSISLTLAEMMGGAITATSKPGAGSRFEVNLQLERTIPLADYDRRAAGRLEKSASADQTAPDGAAGLRVLLAEDHPINQRVVSLILEPYGIAVSITNNGQEAVEAVKAGTFNAILMDMQMPVMDGLTATRAIRAFERSQGRPRTPIAMLSANAMANQIEQSIKAGCDTHISKPVTPEGLIQGLQLALALCMQAREQVA